MTTSHIPAAIQSPGSALIVGGGIVGLASAYYLAKDGWKVTVVDRGDFTDNCSYGNAGMIVPSHFTPLAAPGMVKQGIKWLFDSRSPFLLKPSPSLSMISWGLKFMGHANEKHVTRSSPHILALNKLSRDLYDDLAAELGNDFGWEHRGILMLCKTEKAFEEEVHLAEKARALGLKVDVLNREQMQTVEPNVTLDVVGATHFLSDAHLYPPALMSLLLRQLNQLGVTLIPRTEVTDFVRHGSKITKTLTNNGEYPADTIVFTGGAWLGQLAKKVGIAIPMMPGKGYSFMTSVFEGKVKHPALLIEARVALTPMGGQVRIGGTMELAPINHRINRKRVEGIVNAIPDYYTGYRLPMPDEKNIWHGFRPCSPDGLPYLGRSKSISNLIVAGGMGMMGLSLGPAAGKVVSEVARQEQPSADIRLFDPERFN